MAGEYVGFGESLLVAFLGMSVVFVALISLSLLIKAMSAVINKMSIGEPSAPAPAAPAPMGRPASVSQGEIDLYDVDDQTAALVMAIVAEEMNTPLNELRFRSIRQKPQSPAKM